MAEWIVALTVAAALVLAAAIILVSGLRDRKAAHRRAVHAEVLANMRRENWKWPAR